ncbi:MAG: polysaccharide deacetylase family protein [Alphaproteobacteria bacterium]
MRFRLPQRSLRRLALGALALAALAALAAAPAADAVAGSAVFLMYHRFGETRLPSTNVTIEQFEAHIAELKNDGYTVLPVPEIVAALKSGAPLPDRAIGITIDDAYASVYREAWPRFKAAGLPFTLFVSTDAVDKGLRGMMTWEQIRELAGGGVTIGHHGAAHAHMAQADPAENAADIARASGRFEAELGRAPELFAYPYGEYGTALRDTVAASGFAAAFGQQSGVAHNRSDMFALPRYALNEQYGNIKRFRLVANTLPLPVSDITPSDPLLGPNPPPFGFTVAEGVENLARLACFASGQGAAKLERLGSRRIEVRMKAPFPSGRARINCTVPGPDGRWRWFGTQFVVPRG